MAPQIWDPDRALNINAFDNDTMFCVGVAVSRGGARCRWPIIANRHNRVRSMLDAMAKKPPRETLRSPLLSRLATLSLCEEQHRYQALDIVGRWKRSIRAAAEQYEEIERLKARNARLKAKLAEERELREELQTALENESGDDSMNEDSEPQNEPSAPGAFHFGPSATAASTQERQEWNVRELSLSSKIMHLEQSVEQSNRQAEQLEMEKANLSSQLLEERRLSTLCRQENDMAAKQLDELHSQLSAERQTSERLARELEDITKHQIGLTAQITRLKAQSTTNSQALNQVKNDLEKAETVRAALWKENENLQSQLASKCEASTQLGKKLESVEAELASVQGTLERSRLDLAQSRKINDDQAATDAAFRAALWKENENLQSQLASKCEASTQLGKKLESVEAELASVQGTLERSRLDLAQSRKINDDQAATDAAFRAATTASTAQLLERIKQLEEQSLVSLLNALVVKMKRLAKEIVLWVSGGWWPRRANGTGGRRE